MDTLFVVIAQLIFVTIVYCVAYRMGYRTAHAKALSVVQECAGPVNEMLDKLAAAQTGEEEEYEDKE